MVRLAERCGLAALICRHVDLGVTTGANPAGKAMSLVGAMCAGADSIDDADLLRAGGLRRLFEGIYAPSTLGSFLRSFTHGHVRQLQAAARRFTANLIRHAGLIPPGEPIVFLDIDSKVKQVYRPGKQGASFGYTHARGLHFQIVTASTPSSRPVIIATLSDSHSFRRGHPSRAGCHRPGRHHAGRRRAGLATVAPGSALRRVVAH